MSRAWCGIGGYLMGLHAVRAESPALATGLNQKVIRPLWEASIMSWSIFSTVAILVVSVVIAAVIGGDSLIVLKDSAAIATPMLIILGAVLSMLGFRRAIKEWQLANLRRASDELCSLYNDLGDDDLLSDIITGEVPMRKGAKGYSKARWHVWKMLIRYDDIVRIESHLRDGDRERWSSFIDGSLDSDAVRYVLSDHDVEEASWCEDFKTRLTANRIGIEFGGPPGDDESSFFLNHHGHSSCWPGVGQTSTEGQSSTKSSQG